MTQLLSGELQQVQNGDRKQCLRENNSTDNCAKHVILLGPVAEDGQKAATNSDDVGSSAKRISTLKGHSDLYVCMYLYMNDCINQQIDVFFSNTKPLKADAGWGNTWKSSTIRAQIKETDEV